MQQYLQTISHRSITAKLAHTLDCAMHTGIWSLCTLLPSRAVGPAGRRLVGVALAPPEDDRPRDGLEAERDAAERRQDDDVGRPIAAARVQDVEPLEDVDGAHDDH
uniref:Uncharacterized protein n=1 Tax=Arundo donax TaxID=35708 RepID=A0A0A9EG63_ARUDO